jgi:hypothetical protein
MAGPTRRDTLTGLGVLGASTLASSSVAGAELAAAGGRLRPEIAERIAAAPLVDTHEHLIEERDRLAGTSHPRVRVDDWTLLLSHYLDSDLLVAGMRQEQYGRFFSPQVDPLDKWSLLEPFWPSVKNAGYGRAVRLAVSLLYGVDDLSAFPRARSRPCRKGTSSCGSRASTAACSASTPGSNRAR